MVIQNPTLDEFVRGDGQLLQKLLALDSLEKSKLVVTAVESGYSFEEQSILVDVLKEKFETNISVFHADSGNAAQSVLMLEQWVDEYLNRSNERYSV